MPVRAPTYTVYGFSPNRSKKEEFLVDNDHVHHLREYGPTQKYYDSVLIADVMEDPTSVFVDLKRERYNDARCYCGKPDTRIIADQTTDEPPVGMLFAVYTVLDEEKDQQVVFDWEWVVEDQDRPGHPENYQSDYGRRTWPTT